jgi:Zn-dependent metalloprotease
MGGGHVWYVVTFTPTLVATSCFTECSAVLDRSNLDQEIIDANAVLTRAMTERQEQKKRTTAVFEQSGVPMPTDAQRKTARATVSRKAKRRAASAAKRARLQQRQQKSTEQQHATYQETLDAITAREERAQELAEGRKAVANVNAAVKGLQASVQVVTDLQRKRERMEEEGDYMQCVLSLCLCWCLLCGLRVHSRLH